MRITSEIKSPNYFMSAPYEAGQLIDFSNPPLETDLDTFRNALKVSLVESSIDIEKIAQSVNEYLMSVGITKQENDFQRSLSEFTKPGIATEEMIIAAYAQ